MNEDQKALGFWLGLFIQPMLWAARWHERKHGEKRLVRTPEGYCNYYERGKK